MAVFKSEKIKADETLELNHSSIISGYHLGGYAKYSKELVEFKRGFENKYSIPLDHIYTSKLFHAVFDLIKKNLLPPNSKILVIHSGGLQGNKGFEERYRLV